jgi:chorismate mutase
LKPKYTLNIDICRDELEYLEGEIIVKMVDRAQFALNRKVYEGSSSTLRDWLARFEAPYATLGRFTVAEERPFSSGLPSPERRYSGDLGLPIPDFCVNLNEEILSAYVEFLPRICVDADDGHHGSSIEYDFMALRAVSRRIHFGSYYVAAAKYGREPERYREYIRARDHDGILSTLTRGKREEEIVARIGAKARRMQEAVRGFRPSWRVLVDPEAIVAFYHETIIPLTKKGQVLYLLELGAARSAGPGPA